MVTYRKPSARRVPLGFLSSLFTSGMIKEQLCSSLHCPLQNAAEKPPFFLPSWAAMYMVNAFVVGWVLVVGFGIGGWASMTNFIKQVDTFGLFAKCYQVVPQLVVLRRLFLGAICHVTRVWYRMLLLKPAGLVMMLLLKVFVFMTQRLTMSKPPF
ncbi:hypothetical protein B296_00054961 [Ensete ventricosum]|uniref:Uncharacterized protein n=1 Tax=Ensete ventricosum TaxID=4639 RepID=A0A426XQL7_ENSVE|nr:hypothetical protein B296_00054961 [Ensete ventricosum]